MCLKIYSEKPLRVYKIIENLIDCLINIGFRNDKF